ncbi:MAG: GNAT family N-acetyltransferase [Anaerolineae bacterium]
MIRVCTEEDIGTMVEIINGSARAYEGHIPADCYHQPYMPAEELRSEIAAGVTFYGDEEGGRLVAVMGIQDKGPVVLIRHAYTRTADRGRGIGSRLLAHLLQMTAKPVLIGTWREAGWAIRFYQKHGFRLVSEEEKETLLRTYWSISERQVETSVVLVDDKYDRGLARA